MDPPKTRVQAFLEAAVRLLLVVDLVPRARHVVLRRGEPRGDVEEVVILSDLHQVRRLPAADGKYGRLL